MVHCWCRWKGPRGAARTWRAVSGWSPGGYLSCRSTGFPLPLAEEHDATVRGWAAAHKLRNEWLEEERAQRSKAGRKGEVPAEEREAARAEIEARVAKRTLVPSDDESEDGTSRKRRQRTATVAEEAKRAPSPVPTRGRGRGRGGRARRGRRGRAG